jgi:Uma2 family endonuclease
MHALRQRTTQRRRGDPPAGFRLSREQDHRLGAHGFFDGLRVQIIEGEVFVIAPMAGVQSYPLQELNELLVRALPDRLRVRTLLPLALDDFNEPAPHFAIVPRGTGRHGETPTTALLAIEVADSSLSFDLRQKARVYARCGIPEYWVLDVKERALIVHRSPGATKYRSVKTLKDLSKVTSTAVPGLTVDLRHVFARRR